VWFEKNDVGYGTCDDLVVLAVGLFGQDVSCVLIKEGNVAAPFTRRSSSIDIVVLL
jgi:hypothetical protein